MPPELPLVDLDGGFEADDFDSDYDYDSPGEQATKVPTPAIHLGPESLPDAGVAPESSPSGGVVVRNTFLEFYAPQKVEAFPPRAHTFGGPTAERTEQAPNAPAAPGDVTSQDVACSLNHDSCYAQETPCDRSVPAYPMGSSGRRRHAQADRCKGG